MENKLKRIIGLMLALAMIIGYIPLNTVEVQAADTLKRTNLNDIDKESVKVVAASSYAELVNPQLDEIGIYILEDWKAKKKIEGVLTIPSTYQGKKIVALGRNFNNDSSSSDKSGFYIFNSSSNYIPDFTQVEHLRFIAEYAFKYTKSNDNIEIKDLPNLERIGDSAFCFVEMPKGEANGLIIKDLPKLKSIGELTFSYIRNLGFIKIENLPQLESIGSSAFFNLGVTSDIDLRTCPNIKNIAINAFGSSRGIKNVLIPDPTPNYQGSKYIYAYSVKNESKNGYEKVYRNLHRLSFSFDGGDDGSVPRALRRQCPKPYGIFPANNETFKSGKEKPKYDPANYHPFARYNDPATGDEWIFKGWETNDQFTSPGTKDNDEIKEIKYVGKWEIVVTPDKLDKLIGEADKLLQANPVKENGSGMLFTKKWVTRSTHDTFDTAIGEAQNVYDSLSGSATQKRQEIKEAIKKLKAAMEVFKNNLKDGSINFVKNTGEQPEGAHLVSFEADPGVTLTPSDVTFYVKHDTALPKVQFPKATTQDGRNVVWEPAQTTKITDDTTFRAVIKGVNIGDLQAKIAAAKELLNQDSKSDPATALKRKLQEAEALLEKVNDGTESDQSKVNNEVTELGQAITNVQNLIAEKKAAKTEIAKIQGLKQDEITALQKEVDEAKNSAAVTAVKTKANEQAQKN